MMGACEKEREMLLTWDIREDRSEGGTELLFCLLWLLLWLRLPGAVQPFPTGKGMRVAGTPLHLPIEARPAARFL